MHIKRSMDENYRQLEMQQLLDLLAEETEKNTKAFACGNSIETAYYRTKVNAIIAEINQRKDALHLENKVQNSLDSSSDLIPTS